MLMLKRICSVSDWNRTKSTFSDNSCSIGFVPTMGALHDGHLSLIESCISQCDRTIVSIFVNPTQFGQNEDFDSYPKTLDADIRLLEKLSVDVLLTPTTNDIYPHQSIGTTQISVPHISQLYCGVTRPHFFDGVCSVVLRLFNIIQPTHAFFGEKDFQQFVILKRMVKDLFLPISLHSIPIKRSPSGLALSSRNSYLSPDQTEQASAIFQGLSSAKHAFLSGETRPSELISMVKDRIDSSGILIDYCSIVDSETLSSVRCATPGNRILFAGYMGKTRLIDNIGL